MLRPPAAALVKWFFIASWHSQWYHTLVTTFGSPNRWRYNLLRGLDYFREASLHHGTLPDYRLQGAVNVVQKSLTPDSKVLQAHHEAGAEWFPIDVPVGQPSKWLTLSALRILNWWESGKVTT